MTCPILNKHAVDELRAVDFPNSFDTWSDRLTERAMAEGRPAFWGLVPYHDANACVALDKANEHDLAAGLLHITERARFDGRDPAPRIALFVDWLVPANAEGYAALDALKVSA